MNIENFFPMFEEFNKKYGLKLRYSSPKRDNLLARVSNYYEVEEIKQAVLEGGSDIDATLMRLYRDGINGCKQATATIIEEPAMVKVAVEETKEIKTMENNNNLGNELLNVLMTTFSQFSAEKLMAEAMPLITKKCIEEFGMTPIKHEIKIGEQAPVTLKAELPPCFDRIMKNAVKGNNVMMTGPAGTGKGFMARQVAEAFGAEFYEVNAVKNEYNLTGFVDAQSRYVSTPFYDACKAVAEGRKAVFLFDEMDCSDEEVLKIFNEALEAKVFTFPNNEKLEFGGLIIMSACNTFGTGADEIYCGRPLDASTLNRFVPIRVDYNRKIEMVLAQGDEELVDFIDMFRSQVEKNGLRFVVSYRNIKQIVNVKTDYALKDVMKDCLIKSMADDDLRNILENIEATMHDNVYFRACKGENVKVA